MKKTLMIIQYMAFFSVGIIFSLISPLVINISTDIPMNYKELSLILSGHLIGELFAMIAIGVLIRRLGIKFSLLMGGLLTISGLVGCTVTHHYLILVFARIVTGIGIGIYTIVINGLCADLAQEKGAALNLLNFFFGLGAIGGPIIVSLCLVSNLSWRMIFLVVSILPFIVTAFCVRQNFPSMTIANTTKTVSGTCPRKVWLVLPILCIFIYGGLETSMCGWLPIFWKKTAFRFSPTMMISLFWISLTFGRLIGGKLADYFGFIRFIFYSSWGCIIASLAWNFLSNPIYLVVIVLLIGFFLSGIFPTMLALLSTYCYHIPSTKTVAVISVASVLGGVLIPLLTGKLLGFYGIKILSCVVLSLSFLMMVSFLPLMKPGLITK